MRLKVYHAPTVGAAMALVRDDLGPDALILAHRTVEGGIELTAAQDQPVAPAVTATPAQPLEPRPAAETPSPPTQPPAAAQGEMARIGSLRWHGVPADMAAQLGRGDLPTLIGRILSFGILPCGVDDRPLMFVGPPGAGKTMTVARLATRLKLAGQTSLVITADGRRAGATEQLAAFTRLLGLTLIVADNAKQLARAVARRADGEPVLIDMPGLCPFDTEDRVFIQACQTEVDARVAVVVPAGLDAADAGELAAGFGQLGAQYLVATRLDQSRRLGGILAAAAAGLTCTEAGISPAVADGMARLTPEFLAERLAIVRTMGAGPGRPASLSPLALLAASHREMPGSST